MYIYLLLIHVFALYEIEDIFTFFNSLMYFIKYLTNIFFSILEFLATFYQVIFS